MKTKWLIYAAALVLAATGAQAGAYVGVSAGQGSTEVQTSGSAAFDGSDTAFKILGGYRFIKFFGVEADYRNFGKVSDIVNSTPIEVESQSLDLFAVGVVPIGSFEVFGKAGFSRWDSENNMSGGNDGNDLAYGIGAAYKISKIAVRLEYEQIDIEGADRVDMASVGVDFRF